jgi:hypothetical protein
MPDMRSLILPAVLLSISAWPAAAQSGAATSCVDVRIGDERYYNCLNRQLESEIPQKRFSAGGDAPVDATMPAPAAGLYDQAATREQLGKNFGHSSVPQRPPAPNYPAPLATH